MFFFKEKGMIALDLRTVYPVQVFGHHKFSFVLGLAVGVMLINTPKHDI